MDIFITLDFAAAHHLPCVPEGHKCSNLHGHTFSVEIYLSGPINDERGWVMDFGDVKAVARPIVDQLDHTYLNKIEGLENPTSENIAKWLWVRLQPSLPQISQIIVRESPTSGAVYRGE